MPRLPRVSGAAAIRALERLGFTQVRQRGSHVVLRRDGRDRISGCVVPLHAELAIGTLRGILKQAGIPPAKSSPTSSEPVGPKRRSFAFALPVSLAALVQLSR